VICTGEPSKRTVCQRAGRWCIISDIVSILIARSRDKFTRLDPFRISLSHRFILTILTFDCISVDVISFLLTTQLTIHNPCYFLHSAPSIHHPPFYPSSLLETRPSRSLAPPSHSFMVLSVRPSVLPSMNYHSDSLPQHSISLLASEIWAGLHLFHFYTRVFLCGRWLNVG